MTCVRVAARAWLSSSRPREEEASNAASSLLDCSSRWGLRSWHRLKGAQDGVADPDVRAVLTRAMQDWFGESDNWRTNGRTGAKRHAKPGGGQSHACVCLFGFVFVCVFVTCWSRHRAFSTAHSDFLNRTTLSIPACEILGTLVP